MSPPVPLTTTLPVALLSDMSSESIFTPSTTVVGVLTFALSEYCSDAPVADRETEPDTSTAVVAYEAAIENAPVVRFMSPAMLIAPNVTFVPPVSCLIASGIGIERLIFGAPTFRLTADKVRFGTFGVNERLPGAFSNHANWPPSKPTSEFGNLKAGKSPTRRTPAELKVIDPATVAPNITKLPDNLADDLSVLDFAGMVRVSVGATNLMSEANVRSLNLAEKVKPFASRLPSIAALLRPVMPRSKPSVPFTLKVGTQVAPVAHVSAALADTPLTLSPLTGFHVADDDRSTLSVVPVALRVKVPVAVPRLSASPPLTVNDGLVAPTDNVRLKSVDEL